MQDLNTSKSLDLGDMNRKLRPPAQILYKMPALPTPKIYQAPMEGVVDAHTRELLTRIGGIDVCVTEFIRVCDIPLSPKSIRRLCPEITAPRCETPTGVPVRVQLLGSNPTAMAQSAFKAAQMGAPAIDLNFGCPAKTVNNSGGGACLLQEPQTLYEIISAVRKYVPSGIPVTAKIRLGYEDKALYLENAQAVCEAGASELVVHARSKQDGYKPPAYWEYIARIRETLTIPVIANGEIWSVEDYFRCREISGCDNVMLGRGLMACPDLGRQIKAAVHGEGYQPLSWEALLPMLYEFHHTSSTLFAAKYLGNRLKQWLSYLRLHYPEAEGFFQRVKRATRLEDFEQVFQGEEALAS